MSELTVTFPQVYAILIVKGSSPLKLTVSWFVDPSVNFHLGSRKGGAGGACGFQPQLLQFALSGQ